MYADFKLKFNLQFLPFEHFRYVYSSVLIQPLRSHRLDPARPMSMHGPLHGCSARPNLEAAIQALASRLPIILAGGPMPYNLRDAVVSVRSWAVDVSGSVENVQLTGKDVEKTLHS